MFFKLHIGVFLNKCEVTFREDLLPAPEPKSQRKWFRFTGKRVKKLTKLSSIPIPTVVDFSFSKNFAMNPLIPKSD